MNAGRLVLILLVTCVAGMGCSDKNSVPRGILPTDKMEQVMWDMAQADQYAALYVTKDSAHVDRKAESLRLYAEVLRLHEVSPEEFRKSYRYYLSHPELNQLLFDSVIARGVRARSEMYDRPSTYHAPLPPVNLRPGVVKPGGAGAFVPGAATPGAFVPGVGGVQAAMMQRMREAAARKRDSVTRAMQGKRDSVMRAMQGKRDTTGRAKGRH
jgi:hypothetical protein